MREERELLARYFEGDLTGEEEARLRKWLNDDADARRELGRHAGLEGWLSVALEKEEVRKENFSALCECVRIADEEAFLKKVAGRIQPSRRRRAIRAMTAMAAMLVASGIIFFFASRPEVVATVAKTDADAGIRVGAELRAGDLLEVQKGLVEVRLGGRGTMIVEGPAKLRFKGAMRSELLDGRVLTRVTPSGRGYTIETPGGKVIDLGTEFGISVNGDEVETHVLSGEVKAIPSGENEVLLRKDEGLRFGKGTEERIPARPGSFYSSLPPVHGKEPPFVHWDMELDADGRVSADAKGFNTPDVSLRGEALDQGSLPSTTEGMMGLAVAFDGKGGFMESGFPGVDGREPRTVAFWVKVPRDLAPMESFGILSWGDFQFDQPGAVWQISINPMSGDGPLGHLRVGTHGGFVVGSTDLRDDHWHHVAVVLYEAERPDIGQHVMLYLDGQKEEISSRTLGTVETEVSTANHGVWLGRNITYSGSAIQGHAHGRFFRGCLDEVYIFQAALSQQEILETMRR